MGKLFESVGNTVFNYKDIPDDVLFKMSVTPWSKLYNRDFIERIHAKFPEGLIFDDNVFFWQVLFNADRIYFHNEFLFTRRWYTSSSTTSGDQRYLDSIKIINLIGEEFRKYGEFEHHKITLFNKKVDIGYFRYKHIKKEFKDLYFDAWKNDLLEVYYDEDLFEDFFYNLKFGYKELVLKVLVSKNSEEFEDMVKNHHFDSEQISKIIKDVDSFEIDYCLSNDVSFKSKLLNKLRNILS